MNTRSLARIVRSLYFRRRLARDIPRLEGIVSAELRARGLTAARLGGFIIRLDGDHLSVEPVPPVPSGQLRLPRMENQAKI